ncbi:MAG: phosphate uptake regulator PhoU [Candidatus Latescibacteria bacterium]|jgi:phosphate uptake regulator|nr:phosphate uptake regulator PhoU [Candidatus Latescibacterota bacterium]
MWKSIIELWKSDNLLAQAWRDTYRMLDIDQEMFSQAVDSLRHSDDSADARDAILALDKEVDEFEQEVRRKVLTHCSVRAGSDLTGSMMLVTIVIDIERIGDYTKNIVELARNYPSRLEAGPLEDDLQRIEATVTSNFDLTRKAIENSDEEMANQVLTETKWISKLCDDRVRDLVAAPVGEMTVNQSTALALYFRQLKRINSHLGDVATAVVNPFDRIGFKPKA